MTSGRARRSTSCDEARLLAASVARRGLAVDAAVSLHTLALALLALGCGGRLDRHAAPTAVGRTTSSATTATPGASPRALAPQKRTRHTATTLVDGRVLVAGGHAGASEVERCDVFEPATSTWREGPTLSTPRTGHTATLLDDDQVLLVDGLAHGESLAAAEVCVVASAVCRQTAAPSKPRTDHTATRLLDGRVLVAGGRGYGAPSPPTWAETELFDPKTARWSSADDMSTPRNGHTATLLVDGRVLVVGGSHVDTGGEALASAETFDPATGRWTPAPSPAHARSEHTAIRLEDGRVVVAGGHDRYESLVAAPEVYDPVSGRWSELAPLEVPRQQHAAVLLPGGRVLLAGGASTARLLSPTTSSVEVLDAVADRWIGHAPLHLARSALTASLLPNGRILVVGGFSGEEPVEPELLTP